MEIRWRAAARSWGSTITVLAPFLQTAAGLPGVSRPATTITKSRIILELQGEVKHKSVRAVRLPMPGNELAVCHPRGHGFAGRRGLPSDTRVWEARGRATF